MNRPTHWLAATACLLLGACAALSGKHGTFSVYAPQLSLPQQQSPSTVGWQLLVDTPRASAALATTHIAVMPTPGVIEVYPQARWRDPAPDLLRSLLVQAFDQDGRIVGVSATESGLNGDYSLSIELRDFQIELADGSAHAAIRLTAKLFDRHNNRIVASKAFAVEIPAAGSDVASAFPAFEQALGELLPQLVEWTVQQGEAPRVASPPNGQTGIH
jgi:cholesterol transport system auxiliary component